MANITENTQSPAWSNGIYQIETSDPVLGGANGIANRQAKELAARTQWLKTELAKAVSSIGTNKSSADSAIATKANNTVTLTAGNGLTGGGNLTANRTFALGTPSSITASTTNSVTADSHTHAIDKASTSVAGIVQLYNGLDSSNASRALTAAQGKALNDKITANASDTTTNLATKANNTLTLTAGNGLTGGGNLTANRTFALGTPSSITASTTNSVTADSHTHAVDKASTSVAGIVQLNNTLTSTATNQALTAAQGKALNDKITANASNTTTNLATKANNTLTLTAGNGLTGGGNLTANRTFALGTPSSITADSKDAVTADSHTHAVDKASTTVAGIVQLNNTLTSTATNQALTAAQGKALNDKITANASNTTTNLATKANNTLTLTAGNGLTGGGNLTANRTFALGTPSSITADSKDAVTADSHTHAVDKASTSVAGIVQLNNTLTSTLTNQALTAAQGKALNDKINNAKPIVYTGLDLDTTTTAQFYKNASKGYPENLGGEHAGLIIGFEGDCLQIASGGNHMYIRGSDTNPITADSWSDWAEVLTTRNAYQKNEFALKKAQNGYCKLPNGLIFQWGKTNIDDSSGNVNFPIAFPNALYNVQFTDVLAAGSATNNIPFMAWITEYSDTSKFFINSSRRIGLFAWFAIGI